jgi:hypothetical protein
MAAAVADTKPRLQPAGRYICTLKRARTAVVFEAGFPRAFLLALCSVVLDRT